MEQITLLLVMDKEMKKRLQQQEGSSLFSEIRNIRHVSNIKFKKIEKALQYVLDYKEAETIKIKYLNGEKLKDSFIYDELLMKKNQFYI
ncbi:ArpU family transcriptional regulator [Bacillus thuringiensis]|uniref:ArpU family transcriptional regulator n=2 Tax=Bacillaceae TaxID=186817 RepID=UPI0020D273F3|nr:ArpU family transcriptional regulator [Bacillus thuringiensis]